MSLSSPSFASLWTCPYVAWVLFAALVSRTQQCPWRSHVFTEILAGMAFVSTSSSHMISHVPVGSRDVLALTYLHTSPLRRALPSLVVFHLRHGREWHTAHAEKWRQGCSHIKSWSILQSLSWVHKDNACSVVVDFSRAARPCGDSCWS